MNEGVIHNSFNTSLKLLKSMDLVEELNYSRPFTLISSKFSEKFIHVSQKNDYLHIHRTAMENRDYDILLTDDSFVQFSCELTSKSCNEWSIRYAYYEAPKKISTYEEFLSELGLGDIEDEEVVFYEEYEQYKAESKIKGTVTPIRYDFHGEEYRELVHPTSHIHIGFKNEVRIPINKIMMPLDFTIFILQHVYRKKWQLEIEKNREFKDSILRAKRNSRDIDEDFFSRHESKLYYLT